MEIENEELVPAMTPEETIEKEVQNSSIEAKRLTALIKEEELRGKLEEAKILTDEIKGLRLKPEQLKELEKELAKRSKDVTDVEAQNQINEQTINEYVQAQRDIFDARTEEWKTKDKKQEEIWHSQNTREDTLKAKEESYAERNAELSRRILAYNEDQKELDARYANLVEREEEVVRIEIEQDNIKRQYNEWESYLKEQAASNKKK